MSALTVDLPTAMQQFADSVGGLGVGITGVAGCVENLVQRFATQARDVAEAAAQADSVMESGERIVQSVTRTRDVSRHAAGRMDDTRTLVHDAIDGIATLAQSVRAGEGQMAALIGALSRVEQVAGVISSIARLTNMLALNATIEAARAGEAGKGFAVVANEVKQLARTTAESTAEIQSTLAQLKGTAAEVVAQSRASAVQADLLSANSAATGDAIAGLTAAVATMNADMDAIAAESDAIAGQSTQLRDVVRVTASSLVDSSERLSGARASLAQLMEVGERLINLTIDTGFENADTPFAREAQKRAELVAAALDRAVDERSLSLDDIFSVDYRPVVGTTPQKFKTPLSDWAMARLQGIIDDAYAFSPHILYCCPMNLKGYVPVHNQRFAQSPRIDDPAWNQANSRHWVIYSETVHMNGTRNRRPVLAQVYRRDLGQTQVVVMDMSSPIMVKGRHWGTIRFGYKMG